ncbi:MAG: sugar nucleotide-binding protein [Ignavibacteriota bacterium]
MLIRKILILGCKGTLGSQLMKLYPAAIGWDREDIGRARLPRRCEPVSRRLDSKPEAVINCVAFNDVDGAEQYPQSAFALNREFPRQSGALHKGTRHPARALQYELRLRRRAGRI